MIENEKKLSIAAQSSTSPSSTELRPPIVSVKDAGLLMGRGRTFLRTLHQRGELVPVEIGGQRIGYYRAEVLHWIATRPRKALGAPAIKPIAVPYRRAGGENGGENPSASSADNEKAA